MEYSISNCDLDIEYDKDCCANLLKLFKSKGESAELKKVLIGNLPIGSYMMNTFRYSINKYIEFRSALDNGFSIR